MGKIATRALVIGSVNMDLIVRVDALPRPGETCTGGDVTKAPGGKGANQASAIARLGARTCFCGAVGGDDFGRTLLRDLESDQVCTDGVRTIQDAATGVAFILLQKDGENSIIVAPGANGLLRVEDVEKAVSGSPPFDVVLVQLEIPLDTVEEAARLAKRMDALCVLDAGPPRPISSEALKLFDVVSPNETETEHLVGIRPTDEASSAEAAKALRGRGCGTVVLKLGALGAYFSNGKEEGLVPAYPISAVDTTAAGDAFTAALSLRLAQGGGLREAVSYGAAAGACAAMVLGARPSMPTRDRVETFLSRR